MDQKKNYRVVYTIVERERNGKKYWVRLGAAFKNRDGSLNVYLDAVPTNGMLQIRVPDQKDKPAEPDLPSLKKAGSKDARSPEAGADHTTESFRERRRRLAS